MTEEDEEISNNDIVAFDITFYDADEVEIQPSDAVEVTFNYSDNKNLSKADDEDSNVELQVFHVDDKIEEAQEITINDEKSEEVECGIVIDAESFSFYVVKAVQTDGSDCQVTISWQDENTKCYSTISAAITAAQDWDTVVLEENITTSVTISNKNIMW